MYSSGMRLLPNTRKSFYRDLNKFQGSKGAEKLSGQGKEVNDLKTPETLVNTRFMHIRAENISLSRFEAIFALVFV
jgi:hypothetical protein